MDTTTYEPTTPIAAAPLAEAPAHEACEHCGAPVDTAQRYCVVCGSRRKHAPDPAARFNPEGVHGAAEVIDPLDFACTDASWIMPALSDLIIYELHIGTFTPRARFEERSVKWIISLSWE